MAVEVYSNNTSPRISFSHDLQDAETIPIETYPPSCRLDPRLLEEGTSAATTASIDFAFSIDERIRPEASSTADELFSDGKILPIDIKRDRFDETADDETTATCCADNAADAVIQNVGAASNGNKKELKSLREFLADSIDEEDGTDPDTDTAAAAAAPTAPNPSGGHQKSFWKFRRSNSLNNCEYRNDHARNGRRLIKPLKMLSRSKSAGEYISKQISIIQEERESEPTSFWKFNRSNSSRVDINPDNSTSSGSNKGLIRSIKVLLRSESSAATSCSDNHGKRSIVEDEKAPMPRNSNNQHMRRSSSLNSDHKYHVQVTIGSMTFLSRSNSTGSSAPPKQYYLKQHSIRRQKSMSRTAAGKSYMSPLSDSSTNICDKKATRVKKNCKNGGSSVSATAISPVLNLIPSPNISKATVGLTSLFCNGKDKRKKP